MSHLTIKAMHPIHRCHHEKRAKLISSRRKTILDLEKVEKRDASTLFAKRREIQI
jgi:hypothetical protein